MKLLLTILLATIYTLSAQPLYEYKIIPFDGTDGNQFGSDIAVSDSFLFISAYRKNNYAGVLYIYRKNDFGWEYHKKLVNSDNEPFDRFSWNICLKENTLFISAVTKKIGGIETGVVYIYEYENYDWIEKQKLEPDTLELYLGYGTKVFAYKDYLLIGAPESNTLATNAGKAFLYKRKNNFYELIQVFHPEFPQEYMRFGSNLAITQDFIIIGSPRYTSASGYWAGAVDIYEQKDSLWVWSKQILPEENSDYSFFGGEIGISDNYLVITAMGDLPAPVAGKAYIYQYKADDIELLQIVDSGIYQPGNFFGISVAMNDDSLFIGAVGDTADGIYTGAVYYFSNKKGNWERIYRITPFDYSGIFEFGWSIDLMNNQIIVGYPSARNNNMFTGAVLIYSDKLLNVEEDYTNVIDFKLYQNYPNPFNSSTRIGFNLPKEGRVKIKIYDITGSELKVILDERKQSGYYEVNVELKGFSSGVYFYQAEYFYAENNYVKHSHLTKKAVLIK